MFKKNDEKKYQELCEQIGEEKKFKPKTSEVNIFMQSRLLKARNCNHKKL